jgi:hypothetical protein
MRHHQNLNAPAFRAAAKRLRASGFEVFNPIEASEERYGPDIYEEGDEGRAKINERIVFGVDLAWICAHADAIALLPGWEQSKGARAERAVGMALGLKILLLDGEPHERGHEGRLPRDPEADA